MMGLGTMRTTREDIRYENACFTVAERASLEVNLLASKAQLTPTSHVLHRCLIIDDGFQGLWRLTEEPLALLAYAVELAELLITVPPFDVEIEWAGRPSRVVFPLYPEEPYGHVLPRGFVPGGYYRMTGHTT